MKRKRFTAALLASSLVALPAAPVTADTGDFIAGAIVGGVVGSVVTNNQNKKRAAATNRSTTKTYRPSLPSTQEGRNIQASLNYFGFDAGVVDGQLGRKSRAAVSRYQAYMGYPATGQLSPFEYELLTTSYNRALAGGYATQQTIAASPDGTRGLLKAYRAELAGAAPVVGTQPVTVTGVGVPPQAVAPQAVAPVAVAPVGTQVAAVPQAGAPAAVATTAPPVVATAPTTAATAVPQVGTVAATPQTAAAQAPAGLPNFFAGSEPAAPTQSLTAHCNSISLVTSTNGFVTADTMTDPAEALNEQFCLARTYAIGTSEDLIAKVNGLTADQVAAQCAGFAPSLQPFVASLASKPMDTVKQEVVGFMLTTGMSPAQLAGTSKICLGVGYRTDSMDVALSSALMLFATGEEVYGELIGHHLAAGFGTAKSTERSTAWYDAALAALDGGKSPAFAPGQPERKEIVRKASAQLNAAAGAPAPTAASTLPVFSLTE